MASLWERHADLLLLRVESIAKDLQRLEPEVRRLHLTGAGVLVPVSSTNRTQPPAVLLAERFHREPEGRLRLDHPGQIQEILRVEIHFQVIRGKLDLFAPSLGTWGEAGVHVRLHGQGERLKTATTGQRNAGPDPAANQDIVLVFLHKEREHLERPVRILKGAWAFLHPFNGPPLLRDF
jgi:hypothetical protein